MPIRQMAELIQCHSCNFLSQYARCGALEEAAVIQNFLGLHRRRAEPACATSRHKARALLAQQGGILVAQILNASHFYLLYLT
jgi:hypothetical protein